MGKVLNAGRFKEDNRESTESSKRTVSLSQNTQKSLTDSYNFETSSTFCEESEMKVSAGYSGLFFSASVELGFDISHSKTNTMSRSSEREFSSENGKTVSWETTCPAKRLCTSFIIVQLNTTTVPYSITRRTPGSTKVCHERGTLTLRQWDANLKNTD